MNLSHDKKVIQDIRQYLATHHPDKIIEDSTLLDALTILSIMANKNSLQTQIIEPKVQKGIADKTICKFLKNQIDHAKSMKQSAPVNVCANLRRELGSKKKSTLRLKFKNTAQHINPLTCRKHGKNQKECLRKYAELNQKYTFYMDRC